MDEVPEGCGERICIDRIEPLIEGWPSLVLNETELSDESGGKRRPIT
jgi:hypothetical protein